MKTLQIRTAVILIAIGFLVVVAKPAEAKSYSSSYHSSYKSSYNYKTPSIRSYPSYQSGLKYQSGYYKPSTGTYVQGHFKTYSDSYKWNNRKSLYGY